MDARVREFIENTAQSVVGLDVVLYYQANPKAFDTAAGIALRMRWDVEQVEPVLARLGEHGILEVHTRGDGLYQCYALARDRTVWSLLCRVTEAYLDDPRAGKEIVQLLVDLQRRRRAAAPPPESQ